MTYLDQLNAAIETNAAGFPQLDRQLDQDEEAFLVVLLAKGLIRCQRQNTGKAQFLARLRLAGVLPRYFQDAEKLVQSVVIAVQKVLPKAVGDESLPAEIEAELTMLGVEERLVQLVMPLLGSELFSSDHQETISLKDLGYSPQAFRPVFMSCALVSSLCREGETVDSSISQISSTFPDSPTEDSLRESYSAFCDAKEVIDEFESKEEISQFVLTMKDRISPCLAAMVLVQSGICDLDLG